MSQKILLVDDDWNVLQSYRRQLHKHFQVTTAPGGLEGLKAITEEGPFAVVVSDMRMPGMDGLEFLMAVHDIARDTVRMMLTGNADQKTAMDAVNEGNIFRFLTKPCPPDVFTAALSSGLEHYRLVTAERELLTDTLSGSVKLLTDVLSLVNPVAFGHATSIRQLVRKLCVHAGVEPTWEIAVAAMLSHIGCVTVPESTLAKLARGERLTPDERRQYASHPGVGHDLIAQIPRLRGAAEIVAYQQKHFDGSGIPKDGKHGAEIPFGARVLKLAIDVAQLTSAKQSVAGTLAAIHDRKGWYDPDLVLALEATMAIKQVSKSVEIAGLVPGMVLEENVCSLSGDVLLAFGQEVTPAMCQRLVRFAATEQGVRQPFLVRFPCDERHEVVEEQRVR